MIVCRAWSRAARAAEDKKSFVDLTFDVVANQPTLTSGYQLLGIAGEGAIELHYYASDNKRT
jgi:hypothetical protein